MIWGFNEASWDDINNRQQTKFDMWDTVNPWTHTLGTHIVSAKGMS